MPGLGAGHHVLAALKQEDVMAGHLAEDALAFCPAMTKREIIFQVVGNS